MIEKSVQDNPLEFGNLSEAMRKGSTLKYKDYIKETVNEYQKTSNFVRIYPAKNSDIYDCFFSGPRPINKI